jgi:hypothetical protein
MTNNASTFSEAGSTGSAVSRTTRQISLRLSAVSAGFAILGIATGLVQYLQRSPVPEVHVPGTSAWTPHLIVAAVLCALYGVARYRHRRPPGRLLLLAPLGRSAAARLRVTMRQVSWRSVAALPLLLLIAYSYWRIGEQVIGGLDPHFTINAWGGPTYLGAMTCHYLDAALMIAVTAWLLDKILLPAVAQRAALAENSAAPRPARPVRPAGN